MNGQQTCRGSRCSCWMDDPIMSHRMSRRVISGYKAFVLKNLKSCRGSTLSWLVGGRGCCCADLEMFSKVSARVTWSQ